jgi:hypothetical protein
MLTLESKIYIIKEKEMIYCTTCKKWFQSLGIMRHRQMHVEERKTPGYVHNGRCRRIRHKCTACGRVRMERFMLQTKNRQFYGQQRWICAENKDERHEYFKWARIEKE